jgi:NhaA family Na+:H+ antiporter
LPAQHTGARVWSFVRDRSLLLVVGTVTALVWANLDHDAYASVAHHLHFWVNDVGMVFFFALAAKEVRESLLPGGPLASPREAMLPLVAAVGGMVVPAAIFLSLVSAFGPAGLSRGWAIPSATDIAFSAMVARAVFPAGHPAVPFLLLLAIADDALGLLLLAVFYPSAPLQVMPLVLLMGVALAGAAALMRFGVRSFWPYVLGPGAASWAALYLGGVHPALAMVPVVAFMPHADRDRGLFDLEKIHRTDTLSRFEHWWWTPVQFILLAFGVANAGVVVSTVGSGTYFVLAALLVGKPLGIVSFARMAVLAGARVPAGLTWPDALVVGVAASIGFTVALFFATAAFPAGSLLDQAKMGALLSFAAAPLTVLLARAVRRPAPAGP